MKAPIQEATILVRKGHLSAARNLLEQFTNAYPQMDRSQVDALLYFIYRGMNESGKAIEICDRQLLSTKKRLSRSTWLLRRGLLNLRSQQELEAIEDFQRVISMNCNNDHMDQAQKSIGEAKLKVN